MSMAMGPTAPEPSTEGKDLSGGFFRLRISDGSHTHKMRVHVAPFALSSGSYLYGTPPSGLFSDAGPDVTAAGLMTLLQPFYLPAYSIGFDALFAMVSGQPVEQYPIPSVAAVSGTAVATSGLVQAPAGQQSFNTRDTAGNPFKLIILSPANWTPSAPFLVNDNAGGNGLEKLVHYLAQNGAIRSHAGNKPLAPMNLVSCLNNRLRREYHQR